MEDRVQPTELYINSVVQPEQDRIGKDFQAQIPQFLGASSPSDTNYHANDMMLWAPPPNDSLSDAEINEYIKSARVKHGYNVEQALGMLYWHKHNMQKALEDLKFYKPHPDEWQIEDKVLFEQAFSFHGKCFERIRRVLPDKSISQLVKYYYSWKKGRLKTTKMDSHVKRYLEKGRSDPTSPPTFASDHVGKNQRPSKPEQWNVTASALNRLAVSGNQKELVELDENISFLKDEINSLRSMSRQESNSSPIIQEKVSIFASAPSKGWTSDEESMALLAFQKYGKDLSAVKTIVGNKTDRQIRDFYIEKNHVFSIDALIKTNVKNRHQQPEFQELPPRKKYVSLYDISPPAPSSPPEKKFRYSNENNNGVHGITRGHPIEID